MKAGFIIQPRVAQNIIPACCIVSTDGKTEPKIIARRAAGQQPGTGSGTNAGLCRRFDVALRGGEPAS